MNLFKTEEPYRIADKITNESELSPDLVVHVYFIMLKKTEQIDDEAAYFARTAYQQWNWSNSDFNKLNRVNELRFEDDGQIHDPIDDVIIENGQKYLDFLRDYMNRKPPTPEDWFKIKVGQMVMDGMTYREIEGKTKLNKRYITETIKQLKDDINTTYYSECNRNDSDNVQTSGS